MEIIILNASNLAMAKMRLKTAKATPNGLAYLFLPYTKAEKIKQYEDAIKKYEDGKQA
jgi:hypothetical protein